MKKIKSTSILATVLVSVLATATDSQAAVIAFENLPGPGHFDWNGATGQNLLNVTLPATNQPGVAGTPATFLRLDGQSGTLIRGSIPSSFIQRVNRNSVSVIAGVPIDSEIPTPVGLETYEFSFSGYINYSGSVPPDSAIPEGEQSYLGIRFNLGAGLQYGWIGVVRTGAEVDAFAWGYETEPGVPIAAGAGIPEPATLSLLLIGAVVIVGRRARPAAAMVSRSRDAR